MRVERKSIAKSFQSSVPPVFDIHATRTGEAFEYGRNPREVRAQTRETRPGSGLSNDLSGTRGAGRLP